MGALPWAFLWVSLSLYASHALGTALSAKSWQDWIMTNEHIQEAKFNTPKMRFLQSKMRTKAEKSVCTKTALGLENKRFADANIQVSTSKTDQVGGACARLNIEKHASCPGNKAWLAGSNDRSQWIEFSMDAPAFVSGFATQGFEGQWVSALYLYYSLDKVNWRPFAQKSAAEPFRFAGNNDDKGLANNYLDVPIRARYLRLNPAAWNKQIALRAEIFLCVDDASPCKDRCDKLTSCTWADKGVWAATCSDCPNGYTGTGETACSDLDECSIGNGGCDRRTVCTNTVGSRTCSDCPKGFTGNGADQGGCRDVDECVKDNGGCDKLTTCINKPGTRLCTNCPLGYTGNGAEKCVDVDECKVNNGGCDSLTKCTNLPGSRKCGPCPKGYTGTGENGCVDIDECQTDNGGCATQCINLPGTSTCAPCPPGTKGSGNTKCVRPDELLLKGKDGKPMTNEELAEEAGKRAALKTATSITRELAERETRQGQVDQEDRQIAALEDLTAKLQTLAFKATAHDDETLARHHKTTSVHQDVITETAQLKSDEIRDNARAEAQKLLDGGIPTALSGEPSTSTATGAGAGSALLEESAMLRSNA